MPRRPSRLGLAAIGAVAVVFVIIAAALGSLAAYRQLSVSTTSVTSTATALSTYTSSAVSTVSSTSTVTLSTTVVATSTVFSYQSVTTGLMVPPDAVQVIIAQGAAVNPQGPSYVPDNITVVIGVNNTVVWTNHDYGSEPHTVTALMNTTAPDGASVPIFNSGWFSYGGSFYWTFTVPGTYVYHCEVHPWMVGTVVVKAG